MSAITFVAAGLVDCPTFAHVDYVAEYLQKNLPSFSYRRIAKSQQDWKPFLLYTCDTYGWNHLESPLVWLELGGGEGLLVPEEGGVGGVCDVTAGSSAPRYVGGAGEFWEYCCEYYGLSSVLTREELDMLVCDNIKRIYDEDALASDRLAASTRRRVCVMGANHELTAPLVRMLLELPEIALVQPTEILLFDAQCNSDELNEFADFLDPAATCTMPSATGDAGENRRVSAASMFDPSFLETCHIVIILVGSDPQPGETHASFLRRNCTEADEAAEWLNRQCASGVRVVVPVHGPAALNARRIADAAQRYRAGDVVVASAALGLSALPVLSEIANVPMGDISLPPVWGNVSSPWSGGGYVDCHKAVHHATRFRPNARAMRAKESASLPLGEYEPDQRSIEYLLHSVSDLYRKIASNSMNHPEQVTTAAVTAVKDLLKFWYGPYNGEILSLGIISNGTFGLPEGMLFTQPAILENEEWIPYGRQARPTLDVGMTIQDLVQGFEFAYKEYCEAGEELPAPEEPKKKQKLSAPNYCSFTHSGILVDDGEDSNESV